jgi:hypothetical protein
MINIQIDDSDLIETLDRLSANNWLRPPMVRGLARLQAGMAVYPPTRPGQRYIRGRGPTNAQGRVIAQTSQNLGKRWTNEINERGDGLEGRIGNNTSYGPFVQSAEDQAWVHQGRWQTDEEVANQNEDAIRADFLSTINSLTG